jgi:hypothetical protein
MRRVRAAERDSGGVLIREVLQPAGHPGRDIRERVGVSVEQALALDPLVGVPDIDEAGATLVGGSRDLAGQRFLAEIARHAEQLTRLDVGAESDDQIGEPSGQIGVVTHRA